LKWYGEGCSDRSILLVLAAGWNANDACFSTLDGAGHAWRKAELVALAELCALNGHPISTFRSKICELLRRGEGDHRQFLNQHIAEICPVELGSTSGLKRQLEGRGSSHTSSSCAVGDLEGWVGYSSGKSSSSKKPCLQRGQDDGSEQSRRTAMPITIDVEGSFELPMFQRPLSPVAFQHGLQPCMEVIDVEDEQENDAVAGCSSRSIEEGHVLQLVQMGFEAQRALSALRRAGHDLVRAIELLVQREKNKNKKR
jgi:hypothetical protein